MQTINSESGQLSHNTQCHSHNQTTLKPDRTTQWSTVTIHVRPPHRPLTSRAGLITGMVAEDRPVTVNHLTHNSTTDTSNKLGSGRIYLHKHSRPRSKQSPQANNRRINPEWETQRKYLGCGDHACPERRGGGFSGATYTSQQSERAGWCPAAIKQQIEEHREQPEH